ncbi:hypothetical protein MBLNU230_g1588t2 [Neophaeotheca triangularis]
MAIIQNWLPPNRENWDFLCWAWQFFPLLTAIQWLTPFYPQGKTSITSRYNLPGKQGWFLMEIPGAITLSYLLYTLPRTLQLPDPLPWQNHTMATLYLIHYSYRAILAPLLLNPSMSPIHPLVALSASCWQITNALCLGGWLAGHGPTTQADWSGNLYHVEIGLVVWGWSLLANIFHDDDLREIRRAALRRQKARAEKEGVPVEGVEKLYSVPKNGLFRFVLYPHYLCEWCEWFGFWVISGFACQPARSFLVNEVATMLPRALQGRQWYLEKFGRERVGGRKAVIPGLL